MNKIADIAEMHALRRAQLIALHGNRATLRHMERAMVDRYADLCGAQYDTRNLSDKALEEIATLSERYLERVK